MTTSAFNSTPEHRKVNRAYYQGRRASDHRRNLMELRTERREYEAAGDINAADFAAALEWDTEQLFARAARVGVSDPLGDYFSLERLSDLKRLAPLVDVIRFFSLGDPIASGHRWKMSCPIHHERTPSFFIFPDDQRYKCFGCGAAGDAFDLLDELRLIESFPEAIRTLALIAGVDSDPYLQRPSRTIVRHLPQIGYRNVR